jgi:Fe-S cluster assembly protein SufB
VDADFRLKALGLFERKPMPRWGADLSGIDFDNIKYFVRSTEKQAATGTTCRRTSRTPTTGWASRRPRRRGWSPGRRAVRVRGRLPPDPRGPGAAGRHLPGHRHRAARAPGAVQEYFGSVIPAGDNKFSALNSAVWSGGSFIYVPPGVHVDIPLQAYFRINTENMGQFERTLIIVDEGAYVHYVEGCTAPIYKSDSLHSAVVEIIVKKGGRCRYTTIQNWSNNVYNLVTKRAKAEAGATMEWVDGNLGSKVTMKYPAVC